MRTENKDYAYRESDVGTHIKTIISIESNGDGKMIISIPTVSDKLKVRGLVLDNRNLKN